MKHLKYFESKENKYYIDTLPYICPVCENEGELKDVSEDNSSREEYYKCDICDFEWYSLFYLDFFDNGMDTYDAQFSVNGDRITPGDYISPKLYNKVKLDASKFNL